MNIKKLLEGKDNLKEQLGMNILKSGVFDDLLKTNRHSAQQIVLMKMEERIFSMSENKIIEYFDGVGNMNVQIMPVFYENNNNERMFNLEIFNEKGNSIYECGEEFQTRKEAYIRAAEKLIELSN